MIPTFTLPLGFLALLAIPGLVAIYLLRTRSRRYPVSSLMLWVNQQQARQGGLRVERLQTPLLFFLELLAIILLALAVASPIIRTMRGAIPLMVVLDDSFSMLAGVDETPKSRAIVALEEQFRRVGRFNPLANRRYAVRYVLAGTEPQVLNEPARTAEEAIAQLEAWRCLSPSADLGAAINLAAELSGQKTLILVLTDEPPPQMLKEDRMQWWAFGIPHSNMAFVNATRTVTDSGERCLLEITNLSPHVDSTELIVEVDDAASQSSSSLLHQSVLEIDSRATRRIFLNLPPKTPPFRARIGDDALRIDNKVMLLPQHRKPVLVDVRIQEPRLRSLVENALASTDRVLSAKTGPELLFLDETTVADDSAEAWSMRVITEPTASAYLGPFVIDLTHPLAEGLSLDGVVWGAGTKEQFMGTPIITAGNVPLLTDTERFTGAHEIRLRLRPDLSTLQNSPNWPILMWNLLQWRASQTPGLERTNLRLGEVAVLTTKLGTTSVEVVSPDGGTLVQPVLDRTINLKAGAIGIYEVRAGLDKYAFSSNALYQAESDLTNKATGRWGDWGDATLRWWGYQSFAWFFLLLAIGILTLHLFFVKRET
ncbi:VWA domain-containing protein [Candidatus Poribacteria bacterium]|nr:VWA domain-containing protein [Candidatus Poribacteria bacterium]